MADALALGVCIIAGSAVTLAWARRVGVLWQAVAGLALQGVITVGLFVAVGLWAPDAVAYNELGQQYALHWQGGPSPTDIGAGKEAFPVMLGAIYYVVGQAPALGLAINWVAHGLLIVTLACLATRCHLPAAPTAWIAALFPPVLFWSGLLLRESITWLLMAAFACALMGIAHRITVRDIALLVACLGTLVYVRGTAAIILTGVGVTVLVVTARRRTLLPRLGIAALALLVLLPRLNGLLAGYTTVADIEAKRSELATTAETGFETESESGSRPVASLINAGLRVALGPYPWEWPTLGAPFALDAVLWLAILSLVIVGWWRARGRRELLLVVLPALALAGALMITSGNYGTMQRLRVQTTILLIPLAGAGLKLTAIKVASTTDHRSHAARDAAGEE